MPGEKGAIQPPAIVPRRADTLKDSLAKAIKRKKRKKETETKRRRGYEKNKGPRHVLAEVVGKSEAAPKSRGKASCGVNRG